MRFLKVILLTMLSSTLLCALGINILNSGFEAANIGDGNFGGCAGVNRGPTYIYNPSGCTVDAVWTFESGSGLTRYRPAGDPITSDFNNPVGPDGSFQAALLQGANCTFWQTIGGLTVDQMYTVSFYATQRLWGNFADQGVYVSIDGQRISGADYKPVAGAWTQYSVDFTAGGTSVKLAFTGHDPDDLTGPDETVFVDQVSLGETVPEPGTWGLLASGLAGLVWSRLRKKQ